MQIAEIQALTQKIKENMEKVVVGKSEKIELILAALLAKGHVLLEDVPGTGKTVLAKSLAKSLDTTFKRIQFTPDLLPSDLIGINYYNQKESEFVFREGALFTNVLLADEINRATPRTQSSLLESMEEKQITVDGTTYQLEKPFFVIATENPVETQGTFPLPEAQLDRFLVRLTLGYPSAEESVGILTNYINGSPLINLDAVATGEEINEIQKAISGVLVSEPIQKYIVDLVEATRKHDDIELGISTRGMLAMLKAAQAYAAIHGRDYVLPDDIKTLAVPVFAHRLILKVKYNSSNKASELIRRILTSVSAPTESTSEKL